MTDWFAAAGGEERYSVDGGGVTTPTAAAADIEGGDGPTEKAAVDIVYS